MRPAKTLYDALGLDATATTEQITARAASLLERLNSDGSAHSEDRANQIKIIAYARETLSDPAKRARYDQSLQRQAAVVVEQVSSAPAPSGTPMTHWLLFAVGAAAMALLGDRKSKLSKEDADQLMKLIQEAREK